MDNHAQPGFYLRWISGKSDLQAIPEHNFQSWVFFCLSVNNKIAASSLSKNTYVICEKSRLAETINLINWSCLILGLPDKMLGDLPVIGGNLDDNSLMALASLINLIETKPLKIDLHVASLRTFLLYLKSKNRKTMSPSKIIFTDALAVLFWLGIAKGEPSKKTLIRKSALNKICFTYYEETLSVRQKKLKIETAYQLVLNTDKSLTDIGSSIGFGHREYFITSFKEQFGITPGSLRNHYKQIQ